MCILKGGKKVKDIDHWSKKKAEGAECICGNYVRLGSGVWSLGPVEQMDEINNGLIPREFEEREALM